MRKQMFTKAISAILLASILILSPVSFARAQTQTTPTVGFTLSPSVFPQGQSTSTLLCMSPLQTAGALEFNQNDIIGFNFDSSLGTVTGVDSPISVHSSSLSASDFTSHVSTAN